MVLVSDVLSVAQTVHSFQGKTPLAVKRRRTMLIYLAAGILAVVMSLVPFLFSQQELMSSFIGCSVLFGAIGLGVVGYQYSRDIMNEYRRRLRICGRGGGVFVYIFIDS